MKTKYLLFAMALPALFSACTQDEVWDQSVQSKNPLAEGVNIGPIDIQLTNDEADTRLGQSASGAWDKWSTGDQIGAVLYKFRKIDNSMQNVSPAGAMAAQHPMTLENVDGVEVFKGHTDFFEGNYFVYYPFQTKWMESEEDVQKNYGEYLKVMSPTIQYDYLGEHNRWVGENALQLSGSKLVKGCEAGLNKGAKFTMKRFSNLLSFVGSNGTGAPEILNAPADLEVWSYELTTLNCQTAEIFGYNRDQYGQPGRVNPFVKEGIINASNLEVDNNILIENGWSCTDLSEIGVSNTNSAFTAKEWTDKVTLNVMSGTEAGSAQQNVAYTDARAITFTLLPAASKDIVDGKIKNEIKESTALQIYLVVNTNYGSIIADKVKIKTDNLGNASANGYDKEVTLSQVYWGESWNGTGYDATKMIGLTDRAGRAVTCAVSFDFKNVVKKYPYGCIYDNASLDKAMTWISNMKAQLGDAYTAQTLQLCDEVNLHDMDIESYLAGKVPGVEVTFQQAEEGSTVKFSGSSTLTSNRLLTAWVGKNTRYEIDNGTLTVPAGAGIERIVKVLNNGRLLNNGSIAEVHIDSDIEEYPNISMGVIKVLEVSENGSIRIGNDQMTEKTGRAIRVNAVRSNEGRITLYGNIDEVESNNGTIILKKGENGNLFSIGNIEAEYYKAMEGAIKYTVETNTELGAEKQSMEAGYDLLKALNNYATEVNVNAASVNVQNNEMFRDYSQTTLKINENSTLYVDGYIEDKKVKFNVGEVVVADGKQWSVSNYNSDLTDFSGKYYAVRVGEIVLGSASALYVDNKTVVWGCTLSSTGPEKPTIKGAGSEVSYLYYHVNNITSGLNLDNSVAFNVRD